MRPRWLLLAVVTMSLVPSLASARSPIRHHVALEPPPVRYSIGAALERGLHAGRLVLAFYNTDDTRALELPIRVVADTIQYDWLTVELANATTTRTLSFVTERTKASTQTVRVEPHGIYFETIDLDPLTEDLPPGDYDVRVSWDGHVTTATTFVPYRCGLVYAHSLPPLPRSPSPSKLPYVLGGLAFFALLVASRLAKRAGTADGCVPCSLA